MWDPTKLDPNSANYDPNYDPLAGDMGGGGDPSLSQPQGFGSGIEQPGTGVGTLPEAPPEQPTTPGVPPPSGSPDAGGGVVPPPSGTDTGLAAPGSDPTYPANDPGFNIGTGARVPGNSGAGSGAAPGVGTLDWAQAELGKGQWNDPQDPNYWLTRWQQTGGDTPSNDAYWNQRMEAGTAGEQPGGAYYEGSNLTGNGNFDSLLKSMFGGPGSTQGLNGSNPVQVGNDPFSQLIQNGWGSIIGGGGAPLTPFGQSIQNAIQEQITSPLSTGAFESARGGFQAAHDSMLNQILADLSDRGLVSTPGATSGAQVGAEDQLLKSLAPIFDQNIGSSMNSMYQSALNEGVTQSQNNQSNLLNSLNGAGNYQQMVGNLALSTLKENDSFNQFAANFGLNKDIAAYEIATGQNTQLLNMFAQFLAGVNTSAGGTV